MNIEVANKADKKQADVRTRTNQKKMYTAQSLPNVITYQEKKYWNFKNSDCTKLGHITG